MDHPSSDSPNEDIPDDSDTEDLKNREDTQEETSDTGENADKVTV
jgi:hypothetical protein